MTTMAERLEYERMREGWPDKEIHLFGAGSDSGTFDYFTEVINGKARASRRQCMVASLPEQVKRTRSRHGTVSHSNFANAVCSSFS